MNTRRKLLEDVSELTTSAIPILILDRFIKQLKRLGFSVEALGFEEFYAHDRGVLAIRGTPRFLKLYCYGNAATKKASNVLPELSKFDSALYPNSVKVIDISIKDVANLKKFLRQILHVIPICFEPAKQLIISVSKSKMKNVDNNFEQLLVDNLRAWFEKQIEKMPNCKISDIFFRNTVIGWSLKKEKHDVGSSYMSTIFSINVKREPNDPTEYIYVENRKPYLRVLNRLSIEIFISDRDFINVRDLTLKLKHPSLEVTRGTAGSSLKVTLKDPEGAKRLISAIKELANFDVCLEDS